jgi:hypothetical protein
MALRTARRLVVRGRPPGRAAGRTGATAPLGAQQRGVPLRIGAPRDVRSPETMGAVSKGG